MKTLYWYIRTLAKLALGRGVKRSYAQYGEDIIAAQLLGNRTGIYVDIGCADPVLYSNTYFFYKKGWSGIAIDPNPCLAPRWSLMRRRDHFIQSGVGPTGALTYYQFNDAAYNTFSKEEASRFVQRSNIILKTQSQVPLRPMKDLIGNLTSIDLLSIDAQGYDLAVLHSHDWSVRPRVIIVEDEKFNPAVPADSDTYVFLSQKGYRLRAAIGVSLIFAQV